VNNQNTGVMSGFGRTGNKIPKGYSAGQIQQFNPEQMGLFSSQFSNVGEDSYLSKLANGDQSTFDEMEAPALRQFSQLQGGIASRFSGMGMGNRRSSGFQNAQNSAATNFSQDLQSRRQEMRRQAIHDLMGYSNQILNQRPYDQQLIKKEQSPWYGIAGQLAGGIPGAIASFATGGGSTGSSSIFGSGGGNSIGSNAANFARY